MTGITKRRASTLQLGAAVVTLAELLKKAGDEKRAERLIARGLSLMDG